MRDQELAVLRRDGSLIPVLVDAAPIRVSAQVEGLVVSLTSIAERKRLEQMEVVGGCGAIDIARGSREPE